MPTLQQTIDIAVDHWKGGRLDDAVDVLDTVLQQAPDNPLALYLLGSVQLHKNLPASGVIMLEKAVREDPQADWAWHNLGIAYRQVQDVDAARRCYEKALRLRPERDDTMSMMAGCHVNMGDPEPAIEWADKALKADPKNFHARNHKALALLEMGQWEEGWEYWADRWEVPDRNHMVRHYGCPQWTGGPVKGTLVVHGEQGLGDEILYMSCYHHLVEEVGPDCRIVIEAATRLVPAFKRSFGVPVYGTEAQIMEHEKPDFFIPMGDLPARYRKSDADFANQKEKFIEADPERVTYWRDRLEAMGPGPHIGIAWWGGLAKTHSKIRNAPLDFWKDLVQGPGNYVSVQYETGDTVMEAGHIGVPHLIGGIGDFDDHLALISACDLVVSVIQTAVHEAGGLGVPCISITTSKPSWPFLLEGENMVWYPGVTQYRQIGDDWKPAFEKAKSAIASLAEAKAA